MSTDFQNISMQNYDTPEKWIVILLESDAQKHQTPKESEIKQYCNTIGDVKVFDCPHRCIDFLTDLIGEKVCLILYNSVANTLLPLIHDFTQLKLIYTLRDTDEDETSQKSEWAKFKGSFSTVNDILHHFKHNIRKSEYDLVSISIVSSSTTDNPNELDASFMYSQLLKDVVLQMQYNNIPNQILLIIFVDNMQIIPSI